MAILAPVLIPNDGLFKVGDGRIVVFVIVEGVVDAIVFKEFTDLDGTSDDGPTGADDGSVLSGR